MKNMFKVKDIAERFGIPLRTAQNWSKDNGSWRYKLYCKLEGVLIKELANKVDEINGDVK